MNFWKGSVVFVLLIVFSSAYIFAYLYWQYFMEVKLGRPRSESFSSALPLIYFIACAVFGVRGARTENGVSILGFVWGYFKPLVYSILAFVVVIALIAFVGFLFVK
ncbi:hypothetical protein [Enterovibrio baiacu]|uniref:hypothetical protein n=1 Tax=Enterovibrio baiacu TaxID=2491023 RepID=UPI003D0B2A46